MKPRALIYKTESGVEIIVVKDRKVESPWDFVVKFKEPGKKERTLKHIHIIVEMYVKHAFNPELTIRLKNHIINVFDKLQPINYFPPSLQVFDPAHVTPFKPLDSVGEFTVEFILVSTELIMIQEKTNYPQGSLTRELYEDFGVKDRFSVIQKATLGRLKKR